MIYAICQYDLLYRFSIMTIVLCLGTAHANWLKAEGNKLIDENGKKIILRGLNLPDVEHLNTKPRGSGGKFKSKFFITKAIDEYHANSIRIQVLPHTDGYTGYFKHPNDYIKNHLKPAVDFITSKKTYAIIDLHYVSDYIGKKDKVLNFWQKVAPLFKDNSYVIFELYNEPINPNNWNILKKEIYDPVIKSIRITNPNQLLIIATPFWSSRPQGVLNNPIEDGNIAYSAHIYPNQLKHENWSEEYDKLAKVYPMIVTEWGYYAKSPDPKLRGNTSGFGQKMKHWLESNELSYNAYIFDYLWEPPMFDKNFKPLAKEHAMTDLVQEMLRKNK